MSTVRERLQSLRENVKKAKERENYLLELLEQASTLIERLQLEGRTPCEGMCACPGDCMPMFDEYTAWSDRVFAAKYRE